ncbi:dynein light chain roadblock-type 2 [Neomonachus schauinslandi]|nr:dynein light chain roadblock-type 2 [Neomonachus schauinslandi]
MTRPMPTRLLRPTTPRALVHPGKRPGATGLNLRLRRPKGVKTTSGRKSRPRLPPDQPCTETQALITKRILEYVVFTEYPEFNHLNSQAEVEETLKRIQSHKGVIGTMVVNAEGIPIRTTLDNSTTVQYAGLLHQLTMKARSTVRDIDPQNDLTFLRIRSKKHEIMVAPDKEYLLIVIQNPCE